MAAVWLVILGINLATGDDSQVIAKRASPASPQVFMAFREQERLLSELLWSRETPVAEEPKPQVPRPRSEGRWEMRMG